jgi:hypothetical protein
MSILAATFWYRNVLNLLNDLAKLITVVISGMIFKTKRTDLHSFAADRDKIKLVFIFISSVPGGKSYTLQLQLLSLAPASL